MHENVYMDVDDIKEIQVHKTKMIANVRHCVLFITPQFGNVSRGAREYAALPEASYNTIAKAIIAKNLGMRILINFFMVVNKPATPHRSFTNLEDALKWLNEQFELDKASKKTSNAAH